MEVFSDASLAIFFLSVYHPHLSNHAGFIGIDALIIFVFTTSPIYGLLYEITIDM